MFDKSKDDRILFLLQVWMKVQTCWPSVKAWVEGQLNEELPEVSVEECKDI